MAKASVEDFPPLSEPTVPDEPTPSMETDSITTDDENEAKWHFPDSGNLPSSQIANKFAGPPTAIDQKFLPV
ncbi:hypothetical protein TNIN_415141 [Trichonephila inaurata madagascariensis]|uniref:Uncharacterized protein n=1 Tax=Trichonephila inaurata madagascariensis TaxID=2747483 RepID=A0A8X6YDL3_9ARAC|nr:hypothetical protein TNIN_415141 [Trichonephila inaurata madagascariensis]